MTKQYIEINDRRLDLDTHGDAVIPSGGYIYRSDIERLGLEIKTDLSPFEDLPFGVYQAGHGGRGYQGATPSNRVYRKAYGEEWVNLTGPNAVTRHEGEEVIKLLRDHHEKGRLFLLHRHDTTLVP